MLFQFLFFILEFKFQIVWEFKLICVLFYHGISETYLANIFFHPTMYGWDSLSSLYTRDIMEIWPPPSHFSTFRLFNKMNMDILWFSISSFNFLLEAINNTLYAFKNIGRRKIAKRQKSAKKVGKEFVYSQGHVVLLVHLYIPKVVFLWE